MAVNTSFTGPPAAICASTISAKDRRLRLNAGRVRKGHEEKTSGWRSPAGREQGSRVRPLLRTVEQAHVDGFSEDVPLHGLHDGGPRLESISRRRHIELRIKREY